MNNLIKFLLCGIFTLSAGLLKAQDNVAYHDATVRFTVVTDGVIRLEWQPRIKDEDVKWFLQQCGWNL